MPLPRGKYNVGRAGGVMPISKTFHKGAPLPYSLMEPTIKKSPLWRHARHNGHLAGCRTVSEASCKIKGQMVLPSARFSRRSDLAKRARPFLRSGVSRYTLPASSRRCRGGCGNSPRNRGRSRPRTRWGLQTPRNRGECRTRGARVCREGMQS